MTIELPEDFANWLLNYFLGLPMKDSEQVVNAFRSLINEAQQKAIQADETAVPQPSQ